MIFKRKEGFRFKFDEPIQTTFSIVENGEALAGEKAIAQIIDISPKGIKMFSDVIVGKNEVINPQLELQFVLDTRSIHVYGEIMWSRPFGKGRQYGVFFHNQAVVEELIIEELKLRRKKETQNLAKKDIRTI
ncbi:MAG: PilZ domain-containing protein [Lysinibacillus sp.]